MKERRVAKKKQAMYARMAMRTAAAAVVAATVGQRKDPVTAAGINKCCETDDKDEEVDEGYDEVEALVRAQIDGRDAYKAPFGSLTGRRRPRSLFSPVPSPLSRASTPGLSPVLQSEFRLPLAQGYGLPLPSPTISYASSGSDTSAPATPVTPMGFPVISTETPDETLPFPTPVTVRRRPHSRPRTQFRALSASITARSPLSLAFPLSLSLPLVSRRASTPNTAMQGYMVEDGEDSEDEGGYMGVAAGEDREDPFGMHGSAYYAPRARAALGLGDAYDLSAWAWACDSSPHRGAKKRRHQVPPGQTTCAATTTTATVRGRTVVGDRRSASVYRAPIHAVSAPQLSYVPRPDKELEYLRTIANTTARATVVRSPVPVPVSATTPGYRRGMRPLLLPQKLGLLSNSGPRYEAGNVDFLASGGRRHRTTGWEMDLERGVCGEARTES
jgi:hypothetical protein